MRACLISFFIDTIIFVTTAMNVLCNSLTRSMGKLTLIQFSNSLSGAIIADTSGDLYCAILLSKQPVMNVASLMSSFNYLLMFRSVSISSFTFFFTKCATTKSFMTLNLAWDVDLIGNTPVLSNLLPNWSCLIGFSLSLIPGHVLEQ